MSKKGKTRCFTGVRAPYSGWDHEENVKDVSTQRYYDLKTGLITDVSSTSPSPAVGGSNNTFFYDFLNKCAAESVPLNDNFGPSYWPNPNQTDSILTDFRQECHLPGYSITDVEMADCEGFNDVTVLEKPVLSSGASHSNDGTTFIVIDTNVLLYDMSELLKFVKMIEEHKLNIVIIIPWMVIQELDKLKDRGSVKHGSQEVKFLAIKAIKTLLEYFKSNLSCFRGQKPHEVNTGQEFDRTMMSTNDDHIVVCALHFKHLKTSNDQVFLVTNDRNVQLKSTIYQMETGSLANVIEQVTEGASLSSNVTKGPKTSCPEPRKINPKKGNHSLLELGQAGQMEPTSPTQIPVKSPLSKPEDNSPSVGVKRKATKESVDTLNIEYGNTQKKSCRIVAKGKRVSASISSLPKEQSTITSITQTYQPKTPIPSVFSTSIAEPSPASLDQLHKPSLPTKPCLLNKNSFERSQLKPGPISHFKAGQLPSKSDIALITDCHDIKTISRNLFSDVIMLAIPVLHMVLVVKDPKIIESKDIDLLLCKLCKLSSSLKINCAKDIISSTKKKCQLISANSNGINPKEVLRVVANLLVLMGKFRDAYLDREGSILVVKGQLEMVRDCLVALSNRLQVLTDLSKDNVPVIPRVVSSMILPETHQHGHMNNIEDNMGEGVESKNNTTALPLPLVLSSATSDSDIPMPRAQDNIPPNAHYNDLILQLEQVKSQLQIDLTDPFSLAPESMLIFVKKIAKTYSSCFERAFGLLPQNMPMHQNALLAFGTSLTEFFNALTVVFGAANTPDDPSFGSYVLTLVHSLSGLLSQYAHPRLADNGATEVGLPAIINAWSMFLGSQVNGQLISKTLEYLISVLNRLEALLSRPSG